MARSYCVAANCRSFKFCADALTEADVKRAKAKDEELQTFPQCSKLDIPEKKKYA
jgi:hypothetical protein